jgi:hypothetical protein
MEYVQSEVRRRNIKAPRSEVWKDVFTAPSSACMGVMRRIYGGDLSVPAAANVIVDVYARCSTETHNPAYETVPIRLGLLSEQEAKVMVQFCRMYPIKYQVYDSQGDAVDNFLYEIE